MSFDKACQDHRWSFLDYWVHAPEGGYVDFVIFALGSDWIAVVVLKVTHLQSAKRLQRFSCMLDPVQRHSRRVEIFVKCNMFVCDWLHSCFFGHLWQRARWCTCVPKHPAMNQRWVSCSEFNDNAVESHTLAQSLACLQMFMHVGPVQMYSRRFQICVKCYMFVCVWLHSPFFEQHWQPASSVALANCSMWFDDSICG